MRTALDNTRRWEAVLRDLKLIPMNVYWECLIMDAVKRYRRKHEYPFKNTYNH